MLGGEHKEKIRREIEAAMEEEDPKMISCSIRSFLFFFFFFFQTGEGEYRRVHGVEDEDGEEEEEEEEGKEKRDRRAPRKFSTQVQKRAQSEAKHPRQSRSHHRP